MMKIEVFFFAAVKEMLGQYVREMEVPEGTCVDEVVQLLGLEHRQNIPLIFAVNEDFETEDRKLKNRDRLAIMTPMSGG